MTPHRMQLRVQKVVLKVSVETFFSIDYPEKGLAGSCWLQNVESSQSDHTYLIAKPRVIDRLNVALIRSNGSRSTNSRARDLLQGAATQATEILYRPNLATVDPHAILISSEIEVVRDPFVHRMVVPYGILAVYFYTQL